MATTTMTRERRIEGVVPERPILGAVLAAIGTIVLAGFLVPDLERYSLVTISAVLLVAFGLTREYAYAIPAGITGGVGTMVLLVTSASIAPASVPAAVFLSIAGGFTAVWVLGLFAVPRTTHPWPLIPATILGLIGTAFAAGQPGALDWIQAGVAIVLVVAGLTAIVRSDTH
jgi:hypothetical protein